MGRGPLARLGGAFAGGPPLERASLFLLAGFLFSSAFSISLAQLCAFAGIALWLAGVGRRGSWREVRVPLLFPVAAFAGATLLAALLSDDPRRSLADTRQLSQALIFFWALNLLRGEREMRALFAALVAAASLASLYALLQSFFSPAGLEGRVRGFFSIYMTLGGVLLLQLMVVLSHLLARGEGGKPPWAFAAALLAASALLATYSRSAWLGFAAGLAVALALARGLRWLAALPLALLVLFLLAPGGVRARAASVVDLRDPTVRERLYLWQSGLAMVRDRPLFGFGPDMVKVHYPRYRLPGAAPKRRGHLHNNFLQLAAERGLVGLAAWLGWWGAYFAGAARRLRAMRGGGGLPHSVDRWAVASLSGATAFLAAGMFEYNFGDSEVVMLMYFLMALPFIPWTGARAGEGREKMGASL